MDETTTEAVSQEEQALDAQPVEQQAEADFTADSEPITTDVEEAPEAAEATTSSDDDYADFWAKKGIDISTPEGQAKAAKSYREAEKAMHQKAQQASELEKQIQASPTDGTDRVERLEMLLNATTWKQQNGITPEQDAKMGEYLTSHPEKLQLVKYGVMDFNDVLVLSGANRLDAEALKKQGGQEALQTLANKQRATAASGNAVSAAPAPALSKSNVDTWWDSLGSAGRADPANRAKLDAILNS